MTDRFPPFDPEALPPDARSVHDRIMSERGYLPGPYKFWLAAPEFTDRIEPVEDHLRHGISLEERLIELVVLAVARHWQARYVWTSHAPAAEKAGVSPEVVEAIRAGGIPIFPKDDEAVCHAFASALLEGREVDDRLWAEITAVAGDRGISEIMGLLGLYTSVCLTMVAYRVPTKSGEPDPFV